MIGEMVARAAVLCQMNISTLFYVFHLLFGCLYALATDQLVLNEYAEDLRDIEYQMSMWESDISNKGRASCKTCIKLANSVKRLPNMPFNLAVRIGIEACHRLGFQPRKVCEGAADMFAPWVLQVIKSDRFNAEYACAVRDICPGTRFYSNITLPERKSYSGLKMIISKSSAGKFLHLSDYHLDPEYRIGAEADCGDPICCRSPSPPNKRIKRPAGIYGDYNCDTPRTLALEVLRKAKSLVPNPRFVLVSGDLPPHEIWNTTESGVIEVEGIVAEDLTKYLYGQDLYMTVGNHESSPSNYFPSLKYKNEADVTWLYESLAKQWAQWLPESALDTLKKYGYYSVRRREENLRIISLNTNFGYFLNFWNFLPDSDPNGMYSWLVKELQEGEDIGEQVYILGHISPGTSHKYHEKVMSDILTRYSDTVIAQFYGHTHNDQLEVNFSPSDETLAVSVSYKCPSMTPFDEVNPALRIFESGSNNKLENHYTYYLDLESSNMLEAPQWVFEYDAKASYSLPDLSPKSWSDFVERLKINDTLLAEYKSRETRRGLEQSFRQNEVQTVKNETLCFIKSSFRDADCKRRFYEDQDDIIFHGREKGHPC